VARQIPPIRCDVDTDGLDAQRLPYLCTRQRYVQLVTTTTTTAAAALLLSDRGWFNNYDDSQISVFLFKSCTQHNMTAINALRHLMLQMVFRSDRAIPILINRWHMVRIGGEQHAPTRSLGVARSTITAAHSGTHLQPQCKNHQPNKQMVYDWHAKSLDSLPHIPHLPCIVRATAQPCIRRVLP
jgi:hypothetical protein